MSRSRYKHLVWHLNKDKFFKRLVDRRNRHIKHIPNGSDYKRSVDAWDICDYRIYPTANDIARALLSWLTIDQYTKSWSKY